MRSDLEIETAWQNYADMIRRICFVHLQKNEDTEDVFQNVFFKYAMDKTEFASQEHEKAWMIRVAVNECHSFKRLFFQRKVDLKEDLSMIGMQEEPQYPELIIALLQLPVRYREIVYLHYYEGYSFHEIAQLLKKKEATITTWHRRAKLLLKDVLGGDDVE